MFYKEYPCLTRFAICMILIIAICGTAAAAVSNADTALTDPPAEGLEVDVHPSPVANAAYTKTLEYEADKLVSYDTVAKPNPDPYVFTMTATVTAYCPCVICCDRYSAEHPDNIGTDFEQRTASGTVPVAGRTIAVDPDVIPLGSYVMIGQKVYIAEDTGGLIDGNDIDIYMSDHETANEFGTKKMEVTVYTPEHFAQTQ